MKEILNELIEEAVVDEKRPGFPFAPFSLRLGAFAWNKSWLSIKNPKP